MTRTIYTGAAAALVLFGGVVSAQAGVLAPPGVYFGSGNANANFTVATANGIELGLSAITRFLPVAIVPTGNVYDVPLGDTTVSGKTGSKWGFDFSVNLQPGVTSGSGSGFDLADVTVSLTLQDVANGSMGTAVPTLIPDNTEFGANGVALCPLSATNLNCGPTNWAFQNSETLSFSSIATSLGDSFSDTRNDTYIFTLTVDNLTGASLATDTIIVVAGTGAPVPEPASLILFGSGLVALAARRRRKA